MGIAWYANDLLIPAMYVTRGQTYTFRVEGGIDSNNPAEYHPLYITSSISGGILLNDDNDVRVGVQRCLCNGVMV